MKQWFRRSRSIASHISDKPELALQEFLNFAIKHVIAERNTK